MDLLQIIGICVAIVVGMIFIIYFSIMAYRYYRKVLKKNRAKPIYVISAKETHNINGTVPPDKIEVK